MIVYKYTNQLNGKVYIGITTRSLKRRNSEHLKTIDDGTYFHNAIKKYGIDNFKIEVIDTAKTKKELYEKEIKYIKKYNSFAYQENSKGYNCTFGGEGVNGMTGELNSQYGISPKDRMTEDKYNNWLESLKNPSDETRKIISEVYKNNNFFLGKKHSEKTRKHLSEVRKGKPAKNKKKVKQYTTDGVYVAVYNSITEATSAMTDNESISSICMCCNAKRKTAYGYKWEYVE